MKIERISDSDYIVYYYEKYDKDNIFDSVKNIIKKLQNKLNLKGFYKITYSNKKVGLFIKVTKFEESYYRSTLDLKIVDEDFDVYFKTNDYFIVNKASVVKYYDRNYYALVDDFFEEILEKVEFGNFVFGSDLDVLSKSVVV